MKLRKTLPIFLVLALLIASCSFPGSPTTPSQNLPASGDPYWDRVKLTGRLIFGTSADYAPFEYYDSNFQFSGFDVALARELGARLGLQVEFRDFAFQSLPFALQAGQVDAVIAALSITPERQSQMEFTNIYYSGQEVILARQGSGYGTIVAPTQLGQYRVGVEKGSIYQTWLQTSLVNTGLMPAANLLAYEKPADAIRDLKENRNDIVVMDWLPGQGYVAQGSLEVIGSGLNNQLFAVALPKGAKVLQSQLNQVLGQLQNDGTVARLITQYLGVSLGGTPVAPPPVPTAPPAVIPTTAPAACFDNMTFIADLTIPDNTVLNPRQDFDKIWRFQNSGTCTWTNSYRIVFVQGSPMGGSSISINGTVKPGETYDMALHQISPDTPGQYGGLWQMVNGQSVPFGARVWVRITVPGTVPPPTLPPVPTAIPPVQPTLPTAPVIDYFGSNVSSVAQGGIVTLSWSFSGQGLASARLTRTNPDGTQTPLYGGADVAPAGTYDDLAASIGVYVYSLSVSSEFGGATVRTITVNVNP